MMSKRATIVETILHPPVWLDEEINRQLDGLGIDGEDRVTAYNVMLDYYNDYGVVPTARRKE